MFITISYISSFNILYIRFIICTNKWWINKNKNWLKQHVDTYIVNENKTWNPMPQPYWRHVYMWCACHVLNANIWTKFDMYNTRTHTSSILLMLDVDLLKPGICGTWVKSSGNKVMMSSSRGSDVAQIVTYIINQNRFMESNATSWPWWTHRHIYGIYISNVQRLP